MSCCVCSAKVRMADMPVCVRRRFAAATIFMVLVICCVFCTLLMRERIARIFAMTYHLPVTRAAEGVGPYG